MTQIKAREEARQIPRAFSLYLPPSLAEPPSRRRGEAPTPAPRITTTSSLNTILGQLDVALKRSGKARRAQARSRPARQPAADPVEEHQDYMMHEGPSRERSPSPAGPHMRRRHRSRNKGKRPAFMPHLPPPLVALPKAWFLDVASPTWRDLQAIGKLLHLHPLTLEDILQQDPREKFELYQKLGYHFVSFRIIETHAQRREKRKAPYFAHLDEEQGGSIIGESNIYLVVFNEGICLFHYTDISEHTDRIRNRILQLENVVDMSSEWIAHGVLDSIVDSFFPFLEEIEQECLLIEDVVFGGKVPDDPAPTPSSTDTLLDSESAKSQAKSPSKHEVIEMEKLPTTKLPPPSATRTRFAVPPPMPILRRIRRHVHKRWRRVFSAREAEGEVGAQTVSLTNAAINLSSHTNLSNTPLRRMARTRRLVTQLVRLLASKSEVVTQITKRLLTTARRAGVGRGTSPEERLEVAIYMGDVQDHILTLHHALAHYERMLSQSHPAYLSQLRHTVNVSKQGSDKALIVLTVVSIAVLTCQAVIGLFSQNIKVPNNRHSGKYNVFGIVISLAVFTLFIYLNVVRYWWRKAKRRHAAAAL
ncbi:hypothetical protein BD626DRAFT_505699 [Schizophyllum amplum]|uniref:Cora-like Mg2+ transporter protein-domain-containing protein n=1 Tax=Schizophyllum amplum TaxID=97359 RepID=A0A550C5T5_9AGAR|nr:hypothetical protein BD626DRAFT_505699 [Auriculariopsis ampla]